jgi:type III secretion system YscQ/HrcQ family protein
LGELRRVRPFPFDRLDRVAWSQVEATRVLGRHLPLPMPERPAIEALLGGPIAIRLSDAYVFPSRELLFRLPGPPVPVLARIAASGGRSALLAIDPVLALRLARRVLGLDGDGVVGAWGSGEQRALGALLAPLCDPVGARLEGYVLDDGEIAPLFPDPMVIGFDARVATPAGDGWVRLLAPERLRLRAAPPRAPVEIEPHAARLASAPVRLTVEIGRTLLSRAELASMAAGDVVVFDRFGPRPPLGGPVTLRLGRGRIHAHLDGEGITVVKGFELGVVHMDAPESTQSSLPPTATAATATSTDRPDDKAPAGGARDALLGELPVEVACELGRVTLTGRELLELRPGAVLPVGRPLAGPIDLTVGGRVIARGELVDVEGEIGVRLTQVND